MKLKYTLPYFILLFSLSSIGQTKEEFIECLNLVFSQSEFQPAFSNDVTSNGAVVITADGRKGAYRATTPKMTEIRRGLTQDDFFDFDHPIKVVRTSELERLGIPEYGILQIWVRGEEDNIMIGLSSNIRYENMNYSWNYNLQKVDDEWEIAGRSLNKQRSVIREW